MRLTALLFTALVMGVARAQETPAPKTQTPAPPGARQEGEKMPPVQEPTASKSPQPPAAKFQNAREKLSYALGVDLAFRLKWQRVDVALEWVVKGLQDASANDDSRLLMPGTEAAATVKQFQAQRQRSLAHAMEMLSAKNQKAGASFFAQNARKDGVVTLPSGLQYEILKEGTGPKPTLDDSVQCRYRGTLLDGTEFDSSYKRSEPPTFPLKASIKGWQEALQLMPAGSKWQIAVPPQLAYGERGSGGIGPNATLIFEVELISIREKAQGSGTPGSEPTTGTKGPPDP